MALTLFMKNISLLHTIIHKVQFLLFSNSLLKETFRRLGMLFPHLTRNHFRNDIHPLQQNGWPQHANLVEGVAPAVDVRLVLQEMGHVTCISNLNWTNLGTIHPSCVESISFWFMSSFIRTCLNYPPVRKENGTCYLHT